MRAQASDIPDVVGGDGMAIVTKKDPQQIHLRWDRETVQDCQAIADETERTLNDASEQLVKWAIQAYKLDKQAAAESSRRKKKED